MGEIVQRGTSWERHLRIVELRNAFVKTFLELGKELYEFDKDECWKDFQHTNMKGYLSDPDVDIGISMGYLLMQVYGKWVFMLGVPTVGLIPAGPAKLGMVAEYTTQDNYEENLAQATALTRADLRKWVKDKWPKTVSFSLNGKYRVVYADPPWEYRNERGDGYTDQGDHYELLPVETIAGIPVRKHIMNDAVLFLWATSPILPEALEVMEEWGFNYKTTFVWDKVGHNPGHYNSVRHEFLLIGVHGSCKPDVPELIDSVQEIAKDTIHSRKPPRFREIIDELYTAGRKAELFAREETQGWDAYGDAID